jgi:hypothetical protein
MYTTFCNFLCITVWHIHNKNNQTVVSIHTVFLTYMYKREGKSLCFVYKGTQSSRKTFQTTSPNFILLARKKKEYFFKFGFVILLSLFFFFLLFQTLFIPLATRIVDTQVLGLLGKVNTLHALCCLTSSLACFNNLRNSLVRYNLQYESGHF